MKHPRKTVSRCTLVVILPFPPACECNGWSSNCRFNEALYSATGHGGECLDCGGHRDGPNCERCKENHFESPVPDAQGRKPCEPCNCDPTGRETSMDRLLLLRLP
jgi:hypothetical protein